LGIISLFTSAKQGYITNFPSSRLAPFLQLEISFFFISNVYPPSFFPPGLRPPPSTNPRFQLQYTPLGSRYPSGLTPPPLFYPTSFLLQKTVLRCLFFLLPTWMAFKGFFSLASLPLLLSPPEEPIQTFSIEGLVFI